MKVFSILFLLTLLCQTGFAQSDTVFNQTDAKNLKQGYWKKFYPNGKLMYKGFFKDDKPVGEMRRYFESGALKALFNYDLNGTFAKARLYYENGSPAADGNYFNALKDSMWIYYSFYNKSVTSREFYMKGVRQGISTNYYSSGDISEIIEWKNDKKSGIWEQYFKGTIPKLKANYIDNKLEGEFVVYYSNGKPYITGIYRNDLREGKWTLYSEDGTIQSVLNYQGGKAAEEEKLNAEQQQFFRIIDEAQGKFEEPDETDFLEPPVK